MMIWKFLTTTTVLVSLFFTVGGVVFTAAAESETPKEDSSSISQEEENERGIILRYFLEQIETVYLSPDTEHMTRDEQEKEVLSRLMKMVDMDPTLIDERPLTQNWMEELHLKTLALAPSPAFWKVFLRPPSKVEFESIVNFDTYASERSNSLQDLQQNAFSPHRDRGMVAALSVSFSNMVLQTIQHYAGYATPTNNVIEILGKKYSPIVEVGAGNGYWSAALQELAGADVIAYDSEPPPEIDGDANLNLFSRVTKPFLPVLPGSCIDVIQSNEQYGKRSLLMIWPNNPDAVDNPQHHSRVVDDDDDDTLPIWDIDCLKAYMAVGGSTVIFVGEREAQIQVRPEFPPDVGMSASKAFQTLLQTEFTLVEQFDIPNWWGADDVTVWKRRSSSNEEMEPTSKPKDEDEKEQEL
eukprot:scaffold2571_cov104-Cylindrotheca_fusiformis.AAC.2